ncbi:HAD family hydrolase [Herbaspirillum chlorophenolicum]|uniref:HAD family hydrolase n=1 Tax=Herbaspirillum chlorophenolicum TaxID=211589 RepID=A0ABW8EVC6_9BURK|nr:HAD-IIIA family hydrolase [Herbaspirillum chlorophenolicum]
MPLRPPRAILFDLDGTLADTAPDLAAAANFLRSEHGLEPAPYEVLRPVASAGARGLIGAALDIHPGHAEYESLKVRFLDRYEANMVAHSKLFDSIPDMLAQLEARGIAWGIVTNKAARFTDALVPQIGLGHAACVVSGDTTPHPKPHPAPLLEAAKRLQLAPEDCWYVGDDLRDVQAGKAAGMPTVAAAWGYCGHTAPASWDADALLHEPQKLLELLGPSPT